MTLGAFWGRLNGTLETTDARWAGRSQVSQVEPGIECPADWTAVVAQDCAVCGLEHQFCACEIETKSGVCATCGHVHATMKQKPGIAKILGSLETLATGNQLPQECGRLVLRAFGVFGAQPPCRELQACLLLRRAR